MYKVHFPARVVVCAPEHDIQLSNSALCRNKYCGDEMLYHGPLQ